VGLGVFANGHIIIFFKFEIGILFGEKAGWGNSFLWQDWFIDFSDFSSGVEIQA